MTAIEYMPCKQEHLRLIVPQYGFEDAQIVYSSPSMKEAFENNFSMSAWVNNRCIGAAGLIQLYSHYAIAWAFISRDAGAFNMLRIVRKLNYALDTSPYRRIEMRVRCDFPEGHKLANLCKFHLEAVRMVGSGLDGSDETLYARVSV